MKRLLTLVLLATFTVASNAQTIYPSGVTGCIARWDFSNNGIVANSLPDVSGNNNGAALTNLTASNGFRGLPGHAMHFNGQSSYATVASTSLLNPAQISIVALVKFTGFYNGSCQINNVVYKSLSYNSPGCWAMTVGDQDGNCNAYSPNSESLGFQGPTGIPYTVDTSNYIKQGKWYLFIINYDGNTIKYYQTLMDSTTHVTNIQPIATIPATYSLGTNSSPVTIGATTNGTYPYWFNGDMDELAIFNRAITVADVQSIYDYLWGQYLGVNNTQLTNEDIIVTSNNGIIQVNNHNGAQPYNVSIYDISGKRLFAGTENNKVASIDMSNYPKQMMFVKLQSGNSVITKKVFNQ